jgi:hypothetical protein
MTNSDDEMDGEEYAEKVRKATNEALRSGVTPNEIMWGAMNLLREIGDIRDQQSDQNHRPSGTDSSEFRIDDELE